jgi:hypothetical protein
MQYDSHLMIIEQPLVAAFDPDVFDGALQVKGEK